MKVLVINSGSSSIKYQLFCMPEKKVLAKGLVDKIGLQGSEIKHKDAKGNKTTFAKEIKDHQMGIEFLLEILVGEKYGSLKKIEEIEAVGHRVAHGGEHFSESVLITDEVIKAITECSELAPLHNPANLKGISSMQKILPNIKQVAVFDTAFHQSIPDYAYMYAIPYSLYERYKIRRYGFHGTSHRYVAQRACQILGVDFNSTKIITCHLGNGASLAAIKNGKSVDTSMGMTPIEGVMMGTRSGNLDLGVYNYLMEKENLDKDGAYALVNKKSGVLGVSNLSSDMRELEEAAAEGNEKAILALKMYDYRVLKFIGAYVAIMNGVDIIVFTGGIGENGDGTRKNIVSGLGYLGVEIDDAKNDGLRGKEAVISTDNSKLSVMVVPTNEELVIAQDTFNIIS